MWLKNRPYYPTFYLDIHKFYREKIPVLPSIPELFFVRVNFPRKRNAPRQNQGSELAEQSYSNVEDYHKVQFYSAIDVALACLNDYYDSADLNEYNKLSKMPISGILDRDATKTMGLCT